MKGHIKGSGKSGGLTGILLWALVLAAPTSPASEATDSWTGRSAMSDNWNDQDNWTGGVPANKDDLVFGEVNSRTTNYDNILKLRVNTIEFSGAGAGFTLHVTEGATLDITGNGVSNASGATQTLINDGSVFPGGLTRFGGYATAGNLHIVNPTLFGHTKFYERATAESAMIMNSGATEFHDRSTAGNATVSNSGGFTLFLDNGTAETGTFTNLASNTSGSEGFTQFANQSTAGQAVINNIGGTITDSTGGNATFYDRSTAGMATITNFGGEAISRNGASGSTSFYGISTAGAATITNNGGTVRDSYGGVTYFFKAATAGFATIITNGGTNGGAGGLTLFFDRADGRKARAITTGNGRLDISLVTVGMGIGSIEGSGNYFLGSKTLSVGGNNLSTTVAGLVQDGGASQAHGGALIKFGTGTLTLLGANTYSGGTMIKEGTILVGNTTGSGTGIGPVYISGGSLGGSGTISGPVTAGKGDGPGSFLSPVNLDGVSPGTLSLQDMLTLNADATCQIDFDSNTGAIDQVNANGVAINNATFSFADSGNRSMAPGTILVVISNTSATPINGRFGNLPDGSTFRANRNTFRASYEGGDGNDLTLVVTP